MSNEQNAAQPEQIVKRRFVYQGVRLGDKGKRWYQYQELEAGTLDVLKGNAFAYPKPQKAWPTHVGEVSEITYSGENSYWTSGEHGPVYRGMFASVLVRQSWIFEHESALTREAQSKLNRKEMNADSLGGMTLDQLRALYQSQSRVNRRAILALVVSHLLD